MPEQITNLTFLKKQVKYQRKYMPELAVGKEIFF